MIRTKHIFRQDVSVLSHDYLGDTSVRALAIHHLIERYELDAYVVAPPASRFFPFWRAVFGSARVVADASQIPHRFRDARISAPTQRDWAYGLAGFNVFEAVMWENGFFDTAGMRIIPPIVFPSDPRARAAMIYPAERTDQNAVYNSKWWSATCTELRRQGYAIHLLGSRDHPPLAEFFAETEIDRVFEPTVEGLRACAASSSLAIGGSTGPTWALLFSDIRQIVLESHRAPHGYWFFDRCQEVLAKRLWILPSLESLVPRLD
jgi:hypothetical protein